VSDDHEQAGTVRPLNSPVEVGPQIPKVARLGKGRIFLCALGAVVLIVAGLRYSANRQQEVRAAKAIETKVVLPATQGGKATARNLEESPGAAGPGPAQDIVRCRAGWAADPLTGRACNVWVPDLNQPSGAYAGGQQQQQLPAIHARAQQQRTKEAPPAAAAVVSPQDLEREAIASPIAVKMEAGPRPAAGAPTVQASAAIADDAVRRIEAVRTSLLAQPASAPEHDADRKERFLEASRKHGDDETLASTRVDALSAYEIRAGWSIPAVLEQMAKSDLPGTLRARVSENVYDTATGRFLLIPFGSYLIGKYDPHVSYGQDGLQVVWIRLIYRDGTSMNLDGMESSDVEGSGGVRDQVDRHYRRIFGFAALTSAMSAALAASQTMAGGGGYNGGYYYPSASDQASAAAAREMSQIGSSITRKNLDVPPTIKIRPGYAFLVQVNRDVIFDGPYIPRVK
jgi:type IV secretion system protein VirB10